MVNDPQTKILETLRRQIQLYYRSDQEYLLQTEKDLLTLFGSRIDSKVLTEINRIKDLKDRVLTLLDEARKLEVEAKDNIAREALEANVRALEEDQRLKAEAKLAKGKIGAAQHHSKTHDIIYQIQKSTNSQVLEADANPIEYQAVLTPQTTVAGIQDAFGEVSAADIAYYSSSSISLVRPFDSDIDYTISQTENLLPENWSSETKEKVAQTTTAYLIHNPTANIAAIQTLLNTTQVKIEADGQTIEIPEQLATQLNEINQSVITPEQKLHAQIANQLTQAGIAQTEASGMASEIVPFVPLINTIASYTPTSSSESKDQRERNIRETRRYLSNSFLKYLSSTQNRYVQAVNLVIPQYLYLLPDNFTYAQDYYQSQNLSPQTHQFQAGWLGDLADLGKDKLTGKFMDEASGMAVNAFKNSPMGQQLLGAAAKTTVTGAVEAGAAATGAEAGAAAGTAIAPGVGTVIGLIVGWLAVKSKDILSWLQKNGKQLLLWAGGVFAVLGLGIGASIGGLFGLGGMIAGAGIGYMGGSILGGGSAGLTRVGNGMSNFFNGLVGLAAVEIVWPMIVIILTVPIVVALLLFIINTSALVVPANPGGFTGSNINFIPPGESIECTTEDRPLTVKNDTNPIASAGWSIVNSLKQGFWCYWNNNPSRPDLFNLPEFQKYPNHCVYEPNNPPNCQGDFRAIASETAMYWCTWLIRDAYSQGNAPRIPIDAGANNMKEWFRSQGKYIANTSGTAKLIQPGDAIFLRTGRDSGDYAGHVALVYLVTQDFVFTLDSNASTKTHSYTVSTSGRIQDITSTSGNVILGVIGFGKWQ